jgi:hypothetical protein
VGQHLVDDLFQPDDPNFGGGLYTLHLGDQLAAVHLHLRGEHTIHGWLIAHDPELERYSPGLMLFQDILKSMDGTPYTRLDLGTGDYRFKRELSNAPADRGVRLPGRAFGADPGAPRGVWRAQHGRGPAAGSNLRTARQGHAPHRPAARPALSAARRSLSAQPSEPLDA